MKETINSYVGLDIHKDSIAVAVAQAGRSTPRFIGTAAPTARALCSALKRCGAPKHTLTVYEAGPCGYGWARYLNTHGWHCEVIAPSHITRQPAEKRIQTDRRDALLLARESRSAVEGEKPRNMRYGAPRGTPEDFSMLAKSGSPRHSSP